MIGRAIKFKVELPEEPMILNGDAAQFRRIFSLIIEQALLVGKKKSPLNVLAEFQQNSDQLVIEFSYKGPTLKNLNPMDEQCQEAGLEFEAKMMDGKHSTEILKDLEASDYDLIVMGVMGLGRTRHSQLGSVCERVARAADKDLLVVKQVPNGKAIEVTDTILVGVDGSPQSFGALVTAIKLAKRFDYKVEAVAVNGRTPTQVLA